VSKGYAGEILTKEYGCGLDGVLKTRESDLFGITNGVDYSEWDPSVDPHIREKYGPADTEKKKECKKDLIESAGLDVSAERPVIGVITRLAWQKGVDLIAAIVPEIIKRDAALVILGKGEEKYQKMLTALAEKFPGRVSVNIKFDNALSHKIEAGSDLFLMPSRYEPCGLNQMYSLKYGTVPVVRATGGLDDAIVDCGADAASGNGFKFADAAPAALLEALDRALAVYQDAGRWRELVKRAMAEDHSWEASAREYAALYDKIKFG